MTEVTAAVQPASARIIRVIEENDNGTRSGTPEQAAKPFYSLEYISAADFES